MEELTPEQKKQLGAWVVQRDAILKSIAEKRDEEQKLIVNLKNLAESQTDLLNRIQQSIGRIEELKKKEEEFGTLTTSENAGLRVIKSQLQTEITGHRTEIEALKETKLVLTESIAVLTNLHDKVFDKVNGLESIVGGTVKIASENATEINNILITAGAELQKIIDISEKNVEKTNQLILEIPKIVVDLHRDVLQRKIIARNRIAPNGVELNQK